jgi:hypothetical protein
VKAAVSQNSKSPVDWRDFGQASAALLNASGISFFWLLTWRQGNRFHFIRANGSRGAKAFHIPAWIKPGV